MKPVKKYYRNGKPVREQYIPKPTYLNLPTNLKGQFDTHWHDENLVSLIDHINKNKPDIKVTPNQWHLTGTVSNEVTHEVQAIRSSADIFLTVGEKNYGFELKTCTSQWPNFSIETYHLHVLQEQLGKQHPMVGEIENQFVLFLLPYKKPVYHDISDTFQFVHTLYYHPDNKKVSLLERYNLVGKKVVKENQTKDSFYLLNKEKVLTNVTRTQTLTEGWKPVCIDKSYETFKKTKPYLDHMRFYTFN